MTSRTTRLLAGSVALLLVTSACGSDAATTDDADELEATEVDTAETVTTEVEAADTTAETTEETTADTTADASDDTVSSGSANTAEVVAAADALIATLSDDEADTLMYDFGDTSITSLWSNLPACENGDRTVARAGIQHGDLSEDQAAAVLNLADAVLSDDGSAEYTAVITGDDYLQDTFGNTVWDSDCYFMAIYGTPSETEPFALQFGGHHFARMVTYDGDVATVTPAFTGIEPTSFEVDGTTYAPMDDEMSSIFGLFDDLTDDQIATAEIDGVFDDVLLGPGADDAFPETVGVPVSELTEDQQAEVLVAIQAWVNDFDASVADTVMATIESELADTFISWATTIDITEENAYARIDGPSVWIEAGTQSGLSGVHYHSVYRDKNNDYGDAA